YPSLHITFAHPVALMELSHHSQSQWSLSTNPLSIALLRLAPRKVIHPLADPVTKGTIFLIHTDPWALGGARTMFPFNSSFLVSRVTLVVGGISINGLTTSVIFSIAP